MRLTRRTRHLAPILALVLTVNCGGSTLLKSFRVALASSAPLVNSLASSGVIPQAKAAAIIADFDAGAQCGLTLQAGFTAASALPKPEQKSAKFQAASNAATCFRAIIDRQNFAAHPRIQTAANIAQGILNSLVIFYSPSQPGAMRGPALSEKDFEKQMEQRVKELERSLKP